MRDLLLALTLGAIALTLSSTAVADPKPKANANARYVAQCACDGKKKNDSKATCADGTAEVEFTASADFDDERLKEYALGKCKATPKLTGCKEKDCNRKVVATPQKMAVEKGADEKKKNPADDFIQSMADKHGMKKDEVCKAYERLTLVRKERPLPSCEVSRDSGVKKVAGDECGTHYTLYTPEKSSADPDIKEPIKHTVCQCNHKGEHSEQIVVNLGGTRMANLAYPCKRLCYPFLIKHLHDSPAKKLHISYDEVRGEAANEIHDDMARACAR